MTEMGRQVNTPLARTFRTIVTAGWANVSNGTVEAPCGHFSLVSIEPIDLSTLKDNVLDSDDVVPYPGNYLVLEDSNGNTELIEYVSLRGAQMAYLSTLREYALWDATCPSCPDGEDEGPHKRLHGNWFLCEAGHKFNPIDELDNPFENLPLSPQHEVPTSAAVEQSSELPQSEPDEKLYLTHGCGEVFDDIKIAYEHDQGDCEYEMFEIHPEDKAF